MAATPADFPIRMHPKHPNEQEIFDRSSYIEGLRDQEYTGTALASIRECPKVHRHCANIVRNTYALLFGCERQNLGSAIRRNPAL
jgi:hypothetical protein